jgi:hypothetical protein
MVFIVQCSISFSDNGYIARPIAAVRLGANDDGIQEASTLSAFLGAV